MPTMAKSEIIITDHAIVRYAERILGLSHRLNVEEKDQIAFIIMQMMPDAILKCSSMTITRDGVKYVFKGRTITTVYCCKQKRQI